MNRKQREFIRAGLVTAIIAGAIAVAPMGCQNTNQSWLSQAFGDYVRSLQGRSTIEQIPGLIIAGRDKWLPAGAQYDAIAAGIIREYVKANPQNDAELNKVLEQLAMQLNTKR